MGKRKRIQMQRHDPLSRTVFTKFGLVEVDKIIESWKFQNLVNKRAEVFLRYAMPVQNHEIVDDRISLLPDEILLFIISFLTMREGASTSILSRRWRNLWSTSFSCLNLDAVNMIGYDYPAHHFRGKSQDLLLQERCKFVKWVDQIFERHHCARINSLRIFCFLDKTSATYIDRWIEIVAGQGIQELHLDFDVQSFGLSMCSEKLYKFPYWMFAKGCGSALKHLYLNTCIFKLPPDLKCFNSLISLRMEKMCLNQTEVTSILSNCLYLEWLSIKDCFFPCTTNLKISGPSLRLKHLAVTYCFKVKGIEVEAGNLLSLEYSGSQVRLSFKDVPQLVRISIWFLDVVNVDDMTYALNEVASKAPQLETLFLSTNPRKNILPTKLPTFTNLKRLVFHININSTQSLLELASLLDACPLLQKLEIDLCVFWQPEDGQTEEFSEIRSTLGSAHYNLNEVDIYGFGGHKNEIELAICLLKSAIALENMKIYITVPWFYCGDGVWTLSKKTVWQRRIPLKEVRKLLKKETRSTARLMISCPKNYL